VLPLLPEVEPEPVVLPEPVVCWSDVEPVLPVVPVLPEDWANANDAAPSIPIRTIFFIKFIAVSLQMTAQG
jgi:hypothetical protein